MRFGSLEGLCGLLGLGDAGARSGAGRSCGLGSRLAGLATAEAALMSQDQLWPFSAVVVLQL